MLYITSTPIGNLKDITLRAIEVLKEVDLIAAEDTRHTRILTKHYDIDTPLTSYFEHNKFKKSEYLLKVLQEGKSVALVTDAGTPGISDPGYRLIKLAQENNIPITVVPGACALVAGLSLSGLPTDSFVFEGFLPNKSSARRKKLEALKDEKRTIIFYESPHRITKALKDIEEVLGNPVVACARELTKKFEELRKGTAAELYEHFSRTNPKGEFVLMLNLKRE
ncbi:MAG: 16S rRNA (cytidine(1402)-2'-O)-methyltransferase [Omnitrophica WOR_2 bacterium GWF2_38_59]|nr:MAG: 16S rRNA (cytidine(1402)-2'-O)-methyltransferase [Omnitrophica WOR_2 bacterium GWF2_38_59]OGX50287.1 MAG: 16S rRNA (cytidine(1402)-2'-O)-methyltransferase [Omnitrophica WOR_2 bacterium RIFOXYA2_FULL_38_17]OGX58925.1 MAG: 16S rRNA (cytidine(1402)-2'-O)-methyltransferase [Omnitrophica WOR_2 bacterium RIFOXYC2_FULL_38_12]OGX60534.1 MAG: 16S rRNA (cytidine(1402)-2'-O)-methyltransferase [Omnitrophica WOR_2 bacterium RIFOXYB2_FULL_38_16]